MANLNNKKNKQKKPQKVQTSKIDTVMMGLIFFLLIFPPIIIQFHRINFVSPLLDKSIYSYGNQVGIVGYWSFVLLIVGTILLIACLLYKILIEKYNIVDTKYNLILAFILVSSSITTLLSKYKIVSIIGLHDSYEGLIATFCYIIIFFVLLNIKINQKIQLILLYSLIPFLLINLILGLLDFYGVKLLTESWFKQIIGAGNVQFGKEGFVSSTFLNPNYLSGAAGSIFAFLYTTCLFTKNKTIKITAVSLALLSITLVFVSLSLSGNILLFVFFTVVLIASLFLQPQDRKVNMLYSLGVLLSSMVILAVLANYNPDVWKESVGSIVGNNPFSNKEVKSTVIQKGKSNIKDDLTFNGKVLSSYQKEGLIPKLPDYSIGKFNGRFYIWEKTIDSWKKSPIFGYGLDTLPFVTNTNGVDSVSKMGKDSVVLGASHSMFLNWLYGLGAVGLFGFMILFIQNIFDFIKKLSKKEINVPMISTGFFVLAYLIQGFVNSSRIQSSIIFWIFLGIMVNQMIQNENKVEL